MKITHAMKWYLLAASAVFVGASSAHAVTIDLFDVDQGPIVVDGNNAPNVGNGIYPQVDGSTVTGPVNSIIGGERDIRLANVAGTGPLSISSISVASGNLEWANIGTGRSQATIMYDGVDGNYTNNALSLNANLSDAKYVYLTLELADNSPQITMRFFNTDSNYAEYIWNTVPDVNTGSPFTKAILLSDFNVIGGPINWLDIDAISLDLANTNPGDSMVNLSVSIATAAAPEPSSALAGMGIVAAIGMMSMRRNRQPVTVA